MTAPDHPQNVILASLNAADYGLIANDLERVEMPARKQLERRNVTVGHLHFLDSGAAAVLIGREGLIGVSVLINNTLPSFNTHIDFSGSGRRIHAAQAREAFNKSATLRESTVRAVHTQYEQAIANALSNVRDKLEVRLARYLLMVQDRLDGDELKLTHDVIASRLCVRRACVLSLSNALSGWAFSKAAEVRCAFSTATPSWRLLAMVRIGSQPSAL